jgi:hypothetical protein
VCCLFKHFSELSCCFGCLLYVPSPCAPLQELTWNVGRYPPDKIPLLTGKFTVPPPPEAPAGAGSGAGGASSLLPPTPPSGKLRAGCSGVFWRAFSRVVLRVLLLVLWLACVSCR